ncbi:hypothetical protein LJR164_004508 [Phenylobacterium sp. LjRoot164]|uniref:hypothetical protein n=1 Tax=unclassified Phenylobacterium TaxID=2640670 RepID=UPI003ED0554E
MRILETNGRSVSFAAMGGKMLPYSIALSSILEDWLIRASPQELEVIRKRIAVWPDDDARSRAAEIIARRSLKQARS